MNNTSKLTIGVINVDSNGLDDNNLTEEYVSLTVSTIHERNDERDDGGVSFTIWAQDTMSLEVKISTEDAGTLVSYLQHFLKKEKEYRSSGQ